MMFTFYLFLFTRLGSSSKVTKQFQWSTFYCHEYHCYHGYQSYVLLTDRIEIHQSEPLVWPCDILYVVPAGCDWWIYIQYVDNKQDWQKVWKRIRGCFVFQSHVSMKTVVSPVGHLSVWGYKLKKTLTNANMFTKFEIYHITDICMTNNVKFL